ncbi:hypothetical protein CFC21_067311 [Triticum aestivum]|uniref:Glycosyltransferase n=2 Tax=Triticum aestivum TaxID=4565 RepID=A0A3B6CGY5_WHEAT|nr:UDP-glycosyltransferase 87A2-like [Triticum aestivum]KAF7060523.1 hypothetical protein CFC21_067311 [Triticum aestivum]
MRLDQTIMADAALADHPPCRVVALPYPGRGHVNAMLSLCRLLAARGVATTVILTEEWVGLVGAAEPLLPACVRLTAIPNVIPSEHGRAADYPGFSDAVNTRMEAPVQRLLEEMLQLQSPDMAVVVVVADFLLQWAVPMALKRAVKACTFCPFSATNFAALYHFERLMAGSSLGVEDPMWDQFIPGQTCLTMREFQPILSGEASRVRFKARIRSARAGQCVLFSSFYELEAGVMDSLSSEPSSPRVYSIGPCIPYTTLGEEPRDEYYWAWLDTQPAGSVLYVSLGSFLSLPPSQLAELAMGLAASGVKFMWALHDQARSQVRPLLGGNGNGVLVPWCDQLKVLCHPSVGGFLTHCGMNSVLEAVFAGVPMLTLPIGMDQPTNSRLVVDVWKIGYSLKEKMQPDGIITREAIARAVETLMSSSDLPQSNGVRSRALLWRDASRSAIQEGGSSSTDLNSFLRCMIS